MKSFLLAVSLLVIVVVQAQNDAPFWSLNGNSNATLSNKIGTTNSVSLRFITGNVERMKIHTSGRVGIGTTSPLSLLDLNSPVGTNILNAQVNGVSKFLIHSNGGVAIGSSSTPPVGGLLIGGNLGIGLGVPVVKLHVANGSDITPTSGGYIVSGTTAGQNIGIDDNEIMARNGGAVSALFLNNDGGNVLLNATNAVGNVGIGTSTPDTRFQVKQMEPNHAIKWQHETQADSWTVGIGTNTLNCRFEFNGSLRGQISSVDGSFIAGSDLRLKEDIVPMESILEKIMQLKPSSYYYKDSRSYAKHRSLGFIAQEVEKIIPEAVYEMDGDLKGLNYSAFGVLAVKAIQEQQDKITKLEEQVEQLKKIVERLDGERSLSGSDAWIKQNTPNPVKASTTVQYFIPAETRAARILLTNAEGQQFKVYNVSGSGSLHINTSTLPAGIYQYTLVADGKTVNTKQLVIMR